MEHKTPLSYHFKHSHIWFDMALLAVMYVVAAYVPLLKIVPLIASLELFSFFCFHLMAKRSRFQLQGFLGGFISSTAVFLQTLNDSKFASSSDRDLLLTLLFALCAMLLECVFIIFFLSEPFTLIFYVPFLTQLLCIVAVIVCLNKNYFLGPLPDKVALADKAAEPEVDIELLNDHPIIWKNVVKFSVIILVLIYSMHVIGNNFGLSILISTLLISLFEAHAILASIMTEWSLSPDNIDLMTVFFVILLGNTLSKSFLVLKGSNLSRKGFFVTVLFGSLAISIGVTLIVSRLMSSP
ncbi:DUF4010 domain-containing protein [Aestuariicella hydrocarbonica]|uniref:DUF4010 domain-containing protein n=1 Tax=Pseudomaricurvus hydrocarbonicus TaxID=1470433 RepID=A0A9E5T4R1_9GAMM|nr:DUF4010 domain-containing protein [Aestuariicella hydrocarbonica]NHO68358.1 DUF4010 domain-containing protein [Aestuariicella hydrocarbonica]